MRMGSFKRTVSLAQRDGASAAAAARNGEGSSDTSPSQSPSPKSSRTRPYMAITRLINSWGNPLDLITVLERARAAFPSVFTRRSSCRPGERMKFKGLMPWRRAFFHFLVCFLIGVLGGFTPLLTLDMSKDLASERDRDFSFREGNAVANRHRKIDAIRERDLLVENNEKESVYSNLSLGYNPSFRDSEIVPEKLLIVVTPTHVRPFQAYYLNRLAHTLRVVAPPLVWIVVEVPLQSDETARILRDTGLMYRHLACDPNMSFVKDMAVHQRNVALSHIEKHRLDGIVLFADDDRIFSGSLFDQMRHIRCFGVWPIAVVMESKKKVLIEGPVCNGTKVMGWHTEQRSKLSRRFHADMSGFAFNSTILWDPKRWDHPTPEQIRQRDTKQQSFQATSVVEQLVEDESQMEGLPDGCSRIMVWHLHLEAPELIYPNAWSMQKNLEVVAPLT